MDKEQALEKHVKSYQPGAVLFYEGDPCSKLWVINEGHVQLTRRVCSEDILLETLGPGEFCGELSIVTNGSQPVTATVVDNARIIVIDATQFENMVRTNGEFCIRMLKKLAGRLNEAHFRVAIMQLRNPLGRVMLQLRHEIDNSDTPTKTLLPANLPDVLGMDDVEVKKCLDKLVEKNLISLSKENIVAIVDNDEYSRFLNYLELSDRYAFIEK